MQKEEQLKAELFAHLRQAGAKLMDAGDLTGIVEGPLTIGVSVAIPVPREIVRDLQTAPTKEYYQAYTFLNAKLDEIVQSGAAFLETRGYRAQPILSKRPSDINADWRTPLPHKTVATRAGLGWIGKNCLLVTPEYGGAIRLSSLLTDAPLPTAVPVNESRCGGCRACVDSCPAGALTGVLWHVGVDREEILYKEACKKTQAEVMRRATGIDTDLCGRCFAVCPYTRRYLDRQEESV